MTKVYVTDPRSKREAYVDDDNFLCVQESGLPPEIGTKTKARVFRQFLTTNGFSTGDSDMLVDGSTTNQTFYVQARERNDLYIKSLSFVIADANSVLNEFGNIGALSNGCRLFYEDSDGEVVVNDSLTTNWEFIRLGALSTNSLGGTTTAFRASNVFSTSDGYIPTLDFQVQFGFPFGLPLRGGTTQRVALTIRDNVSGADQFDCVAYGLERLR